jgi:hypothetical protein
MNERQIHLAVLEHAYALLLAEAAKFEAAPLAEKWAHWSNIGECVCDLEELGRRVRLPMPRYGSAWIGASLTGRSTTSM